MCGIAGIFAPGALDARAEIQMDQMLLALRHRGPDDEGTYINRHTGIALGATRLAVVGLDKTGVQPLLSKDGRFSLVVNGEFYGFKTIRADLEARGAQFRSKTDTEVALHLYESFGLDFLNKLSGEFALAIVDNWSKELIIARDRFGVRPLHYSAVGSAFVFASEARSILGFPGAQRTLEPRALLSHLVNLKLPGETLFRGIQTVRPGHALRIKVGGDGRLKIEDIEYWDLNYPLLEDHQYGISTRTHIDQVRDLVIDAVRKRLEADVEIGCYISGGIDSGTVLAVASSLSQKPISSFTLSFDHEFYDEVQLAKLSAGRASSPLAVLPVRPLDLYGENFESAVWFAERPFYNTLAVAKLQLSHFAKQRGFKVVLTGEGSDELFGGYPAFQLELGPAGGATRLANIPEFQDALIPNHLESNLILNDAWGCTPIWIQGWLNLVQPALSLLHGDLRASLTDYNLAQQLAESLTSGRIRGRHALDKAQYTWTKTQLESQILGWSGDRMDMAHAVESRPPFLDEYLAEAAIKIPPDLRMKNGIDKWILREAFQGLVPKAILERPKFPFLSPPHYKSASNEEAMNSLVNKFLTSETIEACGIFDARRVSDFLNSAGASKGLRPNQRDILLNGMLGTQILYSQFISPRDQPQRPSRS